MRSGPPNGDGGDDRPARPRRRPRYAGTHPRRFDLRYKELDPASYPGIHEHVRAQGRTPAGTHVPVLVNEVLAALCPKAGDIVVDCTIGYGGHAVEMLRRVEPGGRLIGLDVDAAQLEHTVRRLDAALYTDDGRSPGSPAPPIRLHRCHFAGIGKVLAREQIGGCDIILADLGASSMQLDDPARGFGYKHDGPLDMRMDDRLPRTAADVLATLSAAELSAHLWELADEPDHERIAEAIVQRRAVKPVTRTRQLARLISGVKECSTRPAVRRDARGQHGAVPTAEPHASAERHPATRTFQALRMMVNDEMGSLEQLLRVAPYCLRPGGRIGIISFHSGEHRRVEQAFREGVHSGRYGEMSEEPIRPTPQEVYANPRSRAARLRWAVAAT